MVFEGYQFWKTSLRRKNRKRLSSLSRNNPASILLSMTWYGTSLCLAYETYSFSENIWILKGLCKDLRRYQVKRTYFFILDSDSEII